MSETSSITPDDDGIVTITISGPGPNLLNPSVMTAITATLNAAEADPRVRAILLTGAGSTFCGGLDLAALRVGNPVEFARCLADLLKVLPRLTKPVAAAVNGHAVASGAALVAACDYAVVLPGAKVGTYEVSVGVWPMVAQVPLIQRIGPRLAMENIGSGDPFTAQRALEVGLVNAIAPAASLTGATREWLLKAVRAGAAGAGRPTVYQFAELGYDAALDAALDKFAAQFTPAER
jgi:enoyl-CoA hydratase/carnithine racemase